MKTELNYHSVLRMMGLLLVVLGIALVLPLVVGLIYGEYSEAKSFGLCIVPCLIAGLILIKLFNPGSIKARHRDVYLVVTLCWIVSSLVGSVPLLLTGAMEHPVDAFFEMCSAVLKPKGKVILHLGKTDKIDMADELAKIYGSRKDK